MSYHLDLDNGKKPVIEMPPLVEEAVIEELAKPDEAVGEERVETAPEIEVAEPVKPVQEESFQARNFRQIKDEAERMRRENAEMSKRLQAYEDNQRSKQVEEPQYNINDDDLLEGKHLKKYDAELKRLRQEQEQFKQQTYTLNAQAQLRSKYPDFDKVVNEENIEALKFAYPEIASTLNSSTDLYSTAVSAYTMIKKLGILPEDNFVNEKALAQKNASKPKPLASVNPQQGDSPLSKANAFANGLTPELQKQLLKEMNEVRRNH